MVRRVFLGETAKFYNRLRSSRQFARDEDGGVFTLFVLLGFIVIIATTGMGVDLMNYERDRANLQATLDRAVLAAADLDQKLPPKDVVNAYLEKAGLQGKLTGDPIVVEGTGSRKVSATAQTIVNTNFMKFSGIPTLTATVASTAEESIDAVEISLVLDMSGSMRRRSAEAGKSKIQVLREAAKKFVTAMLAKENADKISISIIPYATQVNAGADILDKFTNASSEHDYSHCINFTESQFNQAGLISTENLQRTAHFDRSSYDEVPRSPVCPTRPGSEITPMTDDIVKLHDNIDALTPGGNTSIDIGVKWGAALLDPKFRSINSQLAAQKVTPENLASTETVVPSKFKDRPLNDGPDVIKIIIVMTDGNNTEQFKLKSAYRNGYSDVWFNPGYEQLNEDENRYEKVGEYSVRISNDPPEYYWTRQETRNHDHPYGNEESEPENAVRLTYPELFNQASLYWNAVTNYSWHRRGQSTWYYGIFDEVDPTTKDSRTANICQSAKDEGVVIYGIAFEATDRGFNTILNCASSSSHTYRVNGNGNLGEANQTLEDAFLSIASSVRKLRLTQ